MASLRDLVEMLALMLEHETIVAKFAILARRVEEIERRYRPDQPRAPKGTPEGGQWVDDPNSATRTATESTTTQVAEIGERILSWKEPGMIARGIYRFQHFMVVARFGQRNAPAFLSHTSPAIQQGQLINDNRKTGVP